MAKLSDHSSDVSPANSSEQEQLPVNLEEDEEELEAVARTVATDDDDVADPVADEENDEEDNEVYFTLFHLSVYNLSANFYFIIRNSRVSFGPFVPK